MVYGFNPKRKAQPSAGLRYRVSEN